MRQTVSEMLNFSVLTHNSQLTLSQLHTRTYIQHKQLAKKSTMFLH